MAMQRVNSNAQSCANSCEGTSTDAQSCMIIMVGMALRLLAPLKYYYKPGASVGEVGPADNTNARSMPWRRCRWDIQTLRTPPLCIPPRQILPVTGRCIPDGIF